ncbi:hypothetical protein RRG08_029070 [Elysia crispata]|uniref:Uncharacterized protein n=1 Tax=Elysia crispata TaxID=231223 RepID=A0AAE0ZKQ8_9GAST|nr:hypothetical protein RRG08_029070 [Elysia crispata]
MMEFLFFHHALSVLSYITSTTAIIAFTLRNAEPQPREQEGSLKCCCNVFAHKGPGLVYSDQWDHPLPQVRTQPLNLSTDSPALH